MYLIRVDANVLAHLNEFANLEVIQARSLADTARAAALKKALASALPLSTPTQLTPPYRVEATQNGSLNALLWDHARIVAHIPLKRETLAADIDRAHCMAHALSLRQIAQTFLSMEWSPTPQIQEMTALLASARAPVST